MFYMFTDLRTLPSALLISVLIPSWALAQPPEAPREFRAAWVATVENIDWPSRKGLSTADQQRELIAILDKAVELKLNCLVVQIRTSTDALYQSELEPWSVYLTGTAGQAPDPFYDPLEMWVREGHARGIEIHAWFNPYRAQVGKYMAAETHVSKTQPGIVRQYGKYLWLDPGEPQSHQHSLAVFNDVVRRYDIDGIHIDDYFYPYPIKENEADVPFPDDSSWAAYLSGGGTLSRADWRRDNVNRLIRDIHTSTHQIKPWVRFGISPFGIGRPGKAPGITGFDQYEQLYADAALWLNEGWCDYFTPQLYWPISQTPQSFPVLLDYWKTENLQHRHVWPGLFTSRVGDQGRPFPPNEIPAQIEVTRGRSGQSGHVHFSMKALMQNREGLADQLRDGLYTTAALVPASSWLDTTPPAQPTAAISPSDPSELILSAGDDEPVWQFAVWSQKADMSWHFRVLPGHVRSLTIEPETRRIVMTAVDRCGNESSRFSLLTQ